MIDFAALSAPFEPKDLEWRVQRDGKGRDGKPWAMVVCYIDNRAIMNRLDAVVGPANWRNEFKPWEVGGKHGVLCGISIRVLDLLDGDAWVTKWDGADPTDIEPIKGGLSDSMKRAAVQWGIGRYLYELDAAFARIVENRQDGAKQAGKGPDSFWWLPPQLPAHALPRPGKASQQQAQTKAEPTAEEKKKAEDAARLAGPPTEAQITAINALRVVHNLIEAAKLVSFPTYRDALVEFNHLKALPIPKETKAKATPPASDPVPTGAG